MDLLIFLHRRLQRAVDVVHIRPLAQRFFRALLGRRYGRTRLASTVHNGRRWWLVPEVALRGPYAEYGTIKWLREVVQPGMCVFDVGANVGQMTLEMAHLVGPAGKVIAIEPAAGNLAILNLHVNANNFSDRVRIVAAACSKQSEEKVDFKIFGGVTNTIGSGHTLVFDHPVVQDETAMTTTTMKVDTVSIDDLCESLKLFPSVVKIDVEGAEVQVLQGAYHTLLRHRPRVIFGFHPFRFYDPVQATREIRECLKNAGYAVQNDNLEEISFALSEYVAEPLIADREAVV